MVKSKPKVGFDLDGVIVGKPFFIPKSLLEWLYRAHDGQEKKYRVPDFLPEIYLRKASHHWLMRPPLQRNLKKVRKIIRNENIDPYFISGRFSFLSHRTQVWLEKHLPDFTFDRVFINTKNEQPHLFKEKMIKKLGINNFFEDDPLTLKYLKEKLPKIKFHSIKGDNDQNLQNFNVADLL
jgi:hypothetical protein